MLLCSFTSLIVSFTLRDALSSVELFPAEVSLFIGALMHAMDVITTTGLAAECVSWDDTGEVRDSLALSYCQLFSSICPEGAKTKFSVFLVEDTSTWVHH